MMILDFHFLRPLIVLAAVSLLTATLFACSNGDDEQHPEIEAEIQSLQESLEALEGENAELRDEILSLQQQHSNLMEDLQAAEMVIEEQDGRLTTLEEDLALAEEFVDGLEGLFEGIEEAASKLEKAFSDKEQWPQNKDEEKPLTADTVLEMTARLAQDSGGSVHYIDHAERQNRSVLVTPSEIVDGQTPLIVSLHGFGGNSANHAVYIPLHERVNIDGFALLLPNGILDTEGNRFWNPTDEVGEAAKGGADDVAYLTELVANARMVGNFGHVYFFGYSNGAFMSYHMACKGLPGLRAVAALAGASYLKDSACDGAPPVSVLHIHGDEDEVIRFDGDQGKSATKDDEAPAFYVGAEEMVTRWSQRANCEWPQDAQPYATHDFDEFVPGAETQTFRQQSGCAEGITIELWKGVGSNHGPAYGDAFLDALIAWLLAQD